MEEPNHTTQADLPDEEAPAQSELNPSNNDATQGEPVGGHEDVSAIDVAPSTEHVTAPTAEAEATDKRETEESDLSTDSLDKLIREPDAEDLEGSNDDHEPVQQEGEEENKDEADEQVADPGKESLLESSELDYSTTDTEGHDEDALSVLESVDLQRRHSLRTEALIQAAARAVVSMRQGGGDEAQQHDEEADGSVVSSTTEENDDADHTLQPDHDVTNISRPESSASNSLRSPTEESSVDSGAYSSSHHGTEDDVFSDRSFRSSIHSTDDRCDDDALEQLTEKGNDSPHVRSRVTSGVSMSAASEVSDLSRLSRYEKEDFVPTSRNNRPAFRSPSSVRALQMSSPAPSVYSSRNRSPKRPSGFPTISRLGSPSFMTQHPSKGRSSPSRFKKQEAPLVLLHVTLLPLRWAYGDVLDHFEAKKSPPIAFSNEGMKNLRAAWRQVQDRLGDTVLERGILLPHPQSDYEVLEERLVEALELPLRRRARILECGHYLGPSNEMAITDDLESESEDMSDAEGSEAGTRQEKRHWCKTCRGDIKYEELGSERVFRIKVYASNGLMSPGAWEACWKEMERVDIEVEPIVDPGIHSELAKLSAALDHEHQQRLENEQNQQMEEEQRLQVEVEQRLSLEQERQDLEAQRQRFEEERRQALEESQRQLEEERRKIEEEQRRRFEEERRQKFEEDRQLLDAQRQQFEEQRLELEEQRKLIEEEQRQHIEEARRQELEVEHKILDEQRQELEEARQQFEEEQRQIAVPRSTSRNSYVEDEIVSTSRDGAASTELRRRQESDRLREIYGPSRASSDGLPNSSSPSIHIHVDSKRQHDEDQNSRQLATIPTRQDSAVHAGPVQEPRHPDSYISPPSPSEQAYQRRENRRKPLENASLPELLGETIRVLLQDPKNVAIAVLVIALAMLAGQYGKGQERGVEIYKPPHQEPVGQVIMNTPPAIHQAQQPWATQSQHVETIYKTVTAERPQRPAASQEVEVIYRTVTQQNPQETPIHVVETIYSTVTEAMVAPPPAQAVIEPPEDASELPPSVADPSVDLDPATFDSPHSEDVVMTAPLPPFTPVGLDPFTCPLLPPDSEPDSDDRIFKIHGASDVVELDVDIQDHRASTLEQENLSATPVSSAPADELQTTVAAATSHRPLSSHTTTETSAGSKTGKTAKSETATEMLFRLLMLLEAGLNSEGRQTMLDGSHTEKVDEDVASNEREPIQKDPTVPEGTCSKMGELPSMEMLLHEETCAAAELSAVQAEAQGGRGLR